MFATRSTSKSRVTFCCFQTDDTYGAHFCNTFPGVANTMGFDALVFPIVKSVRCTDGIHSPSACSDHCLTVLVEMYVVDQLLARTSFINFHDVPAGSHLVGLVVFAASVVLRTPTALCKILQSLPLPVICDK
jgi:hypothetical protein